MPRGGYSGGTRLNPYRAQLLGGLQAEYQEQGLDIRDQRLQDSEDAQQERQRHNQHMETIADIHAFIAQRQSDALLATNALKQDLAGKQADDVQGAAKAIAGLDPRSETYGRDLAQIQADHPYALVKSANGLEEPIIKAIGALNSQNQTWREGQVDFWKQNQALFNNYAEKGITPVTRDDGSVDVGATMTAFKARGQTTGTDATDSGLEKASETDVAPGSTTRYARPTASETIAQTKYGTPDQLQAANEAKLKYGLATKDFFDPTLKRNVGTLQDGAFTGTDPATATHMQITDGAGTTLATVPVADYNRLSGVIQGTAAQPGTSSPAPAATPTPKTWNPATSKFE